MNIGLLKLSILFLLNFNSVFAFEILPYIQIDYAHYFRLAQCQIKCAQKYGFVGKRKLLDGSYRSFMNTSTDFYEICEIGCSVRGSYNSEQLMNAGDSSHQNYETALSDAFYDGQQFWRGTITESEAIKESNKSNYKSTLTLLGVRVLCVENSKSSNPKIRLPKNVYGNPKSTHNSQTTKITSFGQDALLTILYTIPSSPNKTKSEANHRFIVEWRQKDQGENFNEKSETLKWITASIESTTFRVEGLQSGTQYQFRITAITDKEASPLNRLESEWLDFSQLVRKSSEMSGAQSGTLSFFSQFNLEDNISTIVRWSTYNSLMSSPMHPRIKETLDDEWDKFKQTPLLFESCQMQIEYSNKSTKIVETFTVDESDGYMLRNLNFKTEYTVHLHAKNALSTNALSNPANKQVTANVLNGIFLSLTCLQVYGSGSLECDPEPVQNLHIIPNPENGSVYVMWESSTDVNHILIYELYYTHVQQQSKPNVQCDIKSSRIFLPANTSNTTLQMPMLTECEFELNVIVYDLLGRESLTQKRFFFTPKDNPLLSNSSMVKSFQQIDKKLTIFIVVVFTTMVMFLVLVAKCAGQSTKQKTPPSRNKKLNSLNLHPQEHDYIIPISIKKSKLPTNV